MAAKQFAYRQLSLIGTDESVPALAKLRTAADPVLVESAGYALARVSAMPASRAVVSALGHSHGSARALAAVITLAGEIRVVEGARKLTELARSLDALISGMSIAALGKIATSEAVRILSTLHREGNASQREQAAHALLDAAQRIARRGEPRAAAGIYRALSSDSAPAPVRRGAQLALRKERARNRA